MRSRGIATKVVQIVDYRIHEGSCLAVTLNDEQDYFGQTVNIAPRVQGVAASRSIVDGTGGRERAGLRPA